jgi:hypothetical protein
MISLIPFNSNCGIEFPIVCRELVFSSCLRVDHQPQNGHCRATWWVTLMDVTTDWFWEGNVVEALALHLIDKGWLIESKADTHSKERGVDIQATRKGLILLVEAKGYPSKEYRDPRRASETKRTNPSNQAQQWYSHALLKALRLQSKYPAAKVALAFPDFPRYRSLFEETRIGFGKLGLALLMVKENGDVEEWGLN